MIRGVKKQINNVNGKLKDDITEQILDVIKQ